MVRRIDNWLSEKLDIKGWSMRELARRANVSTSTVSRVVSGELKPSWDFCAAIARPLDEPILTIFKLAGLISFPATKGEITTPEILEIVEIMETMTPETRREILHYAKYLSSIE